MGFSLEAEVEETRLKLGASFLPQAGRDVETGSSDESDNGKV
jgi:hypothetical protein